MKKPTIREEFYAVVSSVLRFAPRLNDEVVDTLVKSRKFTVRRRKARKAGRRK